MRSSGILMHISSLPSPHGIGSCGAAAFDFVDFLVLAGQRYWQILPVGPTTIGDSPYQSYSTFAGNPYFIDLDILAIEGLLEAGEYQTLFWGDDPLKVDYGRLYEQRFGVLRKAFERGRERDEAEIADFRARQADWVEDYALFMALKDHFEGRAWYEWYDGIRMREPAAVELWTKKLAEEIDFWVYVQYQFYNQWNAVKSYANKRGVRIIGDLPIYVAGDSADVWAHPELFCLDEDLRPKLVSGVPPDYFSPKGQLWGNPIYDWDYHAKTDYAWWTARMKAACRFFDVVRIDHFRGFASYYAIPGDAPDATTGHWEKGPGMAVFRAAQSAMDECEIIAEDLGVATPDVGELLAESGFPGMKVLQFAFDTNWDNAFLPHNHKKNCVVYTGTHDNDTLLGWWENATSPEDRQHAIEYLRLSEQEGINWGFIRAAWASVADLAIAPIQDFLGLGNQYRMNQPSTVGENWRFRVADGTFTVELANKIEKLSGLYQRSTL